MTNSILTTTKKALGLGEDYTPFDPDIVLHINAVFFKLQQLGVGPDDGFSIEDKEPAWSDYISDSTSVHAVKTYMYLSVRLLFDPPTTSFAIKAMEDQIANFEWRLNVGREEELHPWVDPSTTEEEDL